MRKLVALLGFVACTSAAQADGPFRWTGLYFGAHGGYTTGDWDGPLTSDTGAFDNASGTIYLDDFSGGFQIGANYQTGNWVWGAEADVSWSLAAGSAEFLTDPNDPTASALDVSTELEMFGTARIRLGYTTGPALVYATGGLAWAKVESSVKEVLASGQPGGATGKASGNHLGFAVGGGLEWAVLSSVTLKAEYLYLNVGDEDYAFEGELPGGAPYDTDHYRPELQFHVIRGGLNVKLN